MNIIYFFQIAITRAIIPTMAGESGTDNPKAEEESENADSYKLTEAQVRLLITERLRAVDTAPAGRQYTAFEEPNFLGRNFDRIEAGHGKDSRESRSATKAKDSPRHCKNEDGVDENEESGENAVAAESYLLSAEAHQQCSNTYQEGTLLITGQFKFMDHRDTIEHEFKDPAGQQLDDNTFKEPSSLGYFYIEAGPIAHN